MKPVIAVIGPTAAGKTRIAVEVAEKVGGEVISVDSALIYRGMDIGTGKDLSEYGEIPASSRAAMCRYLREGP